MTRQLPSKELSGVLQSVPTTATDLTTVNTFLQTLYFNNTTAGALTITVLDKNTVPLGLITTYSVAANSGVLFNFGDTCQLMAGGVRWSASGAGIVGAAFGFIAG